MKAVVLERLGGPEVLRSRAWPDPVPGDDDVVVRLQAAALNHRDVWIRRGRYAKISLPTILGSDGAGTIVAAGKAVQASLVGRDVVINPSLNWTSGPIPEEGVEVLGMPRDGTCAEFVKVPATSAFPKPAHLSFEEAAAVPLAGVTAYRAVAVRARVSESESVLVTGIGGGVALFALLFALHRNARVYVLSGSAAKIDRAVALGASGGALYTSTEWERELTRANGGLFDVVVDGAGAETFSRALKVLKPHGRLVSYGATLGHAKELEIRRIFYRQLDVLGTTMGSAEDFAQMLAAINEGIRPVVDSVFDLDDAGAAHQRMEDGKQFGKIVVRCR